MRTTFLRREVKIKHNTNSYQEMDKIDWKHFIPGVNTAYQLPGGLHFFLERPLSKEDPGSKIKPQVERILNTRNGRKFVHVHVTSPGCSLPLPLRSKY
jgi:hypothetical protein